jgi:hypothetical protein
MNRYDYIFTSKVEANIIENDLIQKNRLILRVSPLVIREINVNMNDINSLPSYQKEMKVQFAAVNRYEKSQRGLYD